MKQIEKLIAETNGLRNVLIQTIEELSELSKECSKRLRLEVEDKTLRETADCILKCNITEEIADVEFCIEQLKHLLGVNALELEMVKEIKTSRTKDLLNIREVNVKRTYIQWTGDNIGELRDFVTIGQKGNAYDSEYSLFFDYEKVVGGLILLYRQKEETKINISDYLVKEQRKGEATKFYVISEKEYASITTV